MVPITVCFIIPLTWCRRWLITSYWNLSTNLSWSSSTFWLLPGYQSNSWWWVPPSSLGNLSYHRQHPYIPFITNLIMLWSSLLTSLCYVLPWSITIFCVKDIVRIAPPLENSWYSNTSRHLHSFSDPRVVSNLNTDNWTMMREFKTSSNPIALELMVDSSFLDYWLSNHHSNIDHAT